MSKTFESLMTGPASMFSQPRSLLPWRLRPREDEAFSSWMVRLAAVYHLQVRSLGSSLTGKGDIEFNTDYDASPDPEVFHALAAATGLDPGVLRAKHTLAGWTGLLYPKMNRGMGTAWVLPLGAYHKLHFAMQFCSLCLDESSPYFRRSWRLSLSCVCPVHGCELRHLCPECASPTHPLKNHLRRGGGAICRCWKCGGDLRQGTVEPADERDTWIARELNAAVQMGVRPSTIPTGINLPDYFTGLALVCARLLGRHRRLELWRKNAAQAAGVAALPAPVGRRVSTSFNSLAEPGQRPRVLRTAVFLLADWPEKFLDLARASGTRTSDFASHFAAAPRWFLEPLQNRLTPPRRKPVPSPGLIKVLQMKQLVLEHRSEWNPTKLPRLVRALRARGFYSPQTDDSIIMRSLPKLIARLRREGADYRKRLTRRVERGSHEWSELLLLARPYRKTHCKNPDILRRGIRLLCRDRFLSSADLGALTHRSHRVLMNWHLMPMVRAGELHTRFKANRGGSLSYPGQAYRTSPDFAPVTDAVVA